MHARHWLRDNNDGLVYAAEFDGGNVVGLAGPIPFHEIGKVMLGRYSYAPDRAAEMNGRDYAIMTQAEIHAIGQGYANRQGMPVLDGTPQDATQPDARPVSVPGPNPPETADKEHPVGLFGTQDHPELSIGDQPAMLALEGEKPDTPVPDEEAPETPGEVAEMHRRASASATDDEATDTDTPPEGAAGTAGTRRQAAATKGKEEKKATASKKR